MEFKKTILVLASIFTLVLMTSSVSAGISLYPDNYEANISHGDSDSFELKIENTYENWSLFNFSIENTSSLDNFDIIGENPGSINPKTNESINIDISVPKQTSGGTYTEKIEINPMRKNVSNSSDTNGFPGPKELEITINIPEDKDLSISGTNFNGNKETQITIINNGNEDLSNINLTSSGDFDVNFSEDNFDLTLGDSKDIELTITSETDDLDLGANEITIKVNSSEGISDEKELTYEKSFLGETENIKDDFEIDDFEITIDEGFGDEDDEKFFPLDKIIAEFNLENKGDWDVEDIEIEACLYDINEKECVMDEDDMELSEDKFDIDENEDKDLEISFRINPDELNIGNEDFRLYVKAIGEIDNADDESYDEKETGVSDYESFKINQDEFLIVDELEINPEKENYACDSEITIRGKLWNIGNEDLEEDEVYLGSYNKDLGISEVIDIGDLDALESTDFELTLNIPEEIDEKVYRIDFVVYDDEDMNDNDVYEIDNDDEDKAIYTLPLEVEGSCTTPEVDLSGTSLVSGEYSGETFVINTTISNAGNSDTDYTLSVTDYSDWADSVEYNKQTFSLESGQEGKIQLKLKSKQDVSGDKSFNLEIYSGNELIKKQPIQVSIKEDSSFIDFEFSNLVKILSGAIGILLIVIIIVLLVKLSRRKKE